MNRYICTFGANQEHEGKYVLVIASNIEAARNKMFEEYGNEWCMCYSEEKWNNTPRYIPRETLLRTIVAEEVEEERNFYCPKCNTKLEFERSIYDDKNNIYCTYSNCCNCSSNYRIEEDNVIKIVEYMKYSRSELEDIKIFKKEIEKELKRLREKEREIELEILRLSEESNEI